MEFDKKTLKTLAQNYQSAQEGEKLLEMMEHNPNFKDEYLQKLNEMKAENTSEILIKPRSSSKVTLVAFSRADFEELKKTGANKLFPESANLTYALYDEKTHSLKNEFTPEINNGRAR